MQMPAVHSKFAKLLVQTLLQNVEKMKPDGILCQVQCRANLRDGFFVI